MLAGVQSSAKRGVLKEVKKVIFISAMDMLIEDMSDMPDMEWPVAEAMGIVEVDDMVMPGMSISMVKAKTKMKMTRC